MSAPTAGGGADGGSVRSAEGPAGAAAEAAAAAPGAASGAATEELRWRTVEEVLSPDEAAKLARDTQAELLGPGFAPRARAAMARGQAVRHEARALLLLGPSAAGKSSALERGWVHGPPGALTLDGSTIREVSGSWGRALAAAELCGFAGLANYFADYFRTSMNKVKDQIFIEAVQSGSNLIIPDTSSNFQKTVSMVDKLLESGYELRVVAIFADRRVCEIRGSQRRAKKYEGHNWEVSVKSILDMHEHLRSAGALGRVGGIEVASTNGPYQAITLQQVSDSLQWHRRTVDANGKWCEIRLLAGVYRAAVAEGEAFPAAASANADAAGCAARARHFELQPANLEDEVVAVIMRTIEEGAEVERQELSFDVSSCSLRRGRPSERRHGCREDGALGGAPASPTSASRWPPPRAGGGPAAPPAGGGWRLSLDADGRAALRGDGGGYSDLLQVEPIEGSSLSHPAHEDADLLRALDGLDFCHAGLRPVNREELQLAAASTHLEGPEEAPPREQPRALLVVAPSGCGKTSAERFVVGDFDMKLEEAVIVDSKFVRDFHAQYRAIVRNGRTNRGIWYRAWPAVKAVVTKVKQDILAAAVAGRKDLVVSDTGSEEANLLRVIEKLNMQGYTVNLCCIFADPKEIVARGVARELKAGKRYNRDGQKLRKSFDSFVPASRAINGKFCIVRNEGKLPELYRAGARGELASFCLEEALAWRPTASPRRLAAPPQRGPPLGGGGSPSDGEATEGEASPLQPGAAALSVAPLWPQDLAYLMEGNANVVCAFVGKAGDWRGCAVRLQKADNAACRAAHTFQRLVGPRLFGPEYVGDASLVGLPTECVRAIDEAIFSQRRAGRCAKRLDAQVRDPCGLVLAQKVTNLVAAPALSSICSFGPLPVVTVELKPKCGLLECRGLPSRFRLLQYHKLAAGEITSVSAYDPTKLLSKRHSLVLEALESTMTTPQNNFRVFVATPPGVFGQLVFSDDLLPQPSGSDPAAGAAEAARQRLRAALREAGLQDDGHLLAIVAAVLTAPGMQLPDRLKRAQAWAAGETARLARELHASLREQDPQAAEDAAVLQDEHLEDAIEGLEALPCDEGGIDHAVAQMDALLTRVRSEPWGRDLQREVVRWLCRFLLGRTAHDVGVLVSVVRVPSAGVFAEELEKELKAHRFRPLEINGAWPSAYGTSWERLGGALALDGPPYGPPCLGGDLWFRATVVDIDRKSGRKILEYATQLDTYMDAYCRRRAHGPPSSRPSAALVPGTASAGARQRPAWQLSGHAGGFVFEADVLWKRDQGGRRGQAELEFLRAAVDDPSCRGLVPAFMGYRMRDGVGWIGMTNLAHGLAEPALLDIKMGTRTWGTDAGPEKVASQSQKASASTTSCLGCRVVAGVLRGADGELAQVGHLKGQPVESERALEALLGTFLCTEGLRRSAVGRLREVEVWWRRQESFALYASSLLFAYDASRSDDCRVAVIDFANCERVTTKSQDLSGFDTGLNTLLRIVLGLIPARG